MPEDNEQKFGIQVWIRSSPYGGTSGWAKLGGKLALYPHKDAAQAQADIWSAAIHPENVTYLPKLCEDHIIVNQPGSEANERDA